MRTTPTSDTPTRRTPAPGRPETVRVLIPLRGIAALAVAWYHLTNGGPLVAPHGWLAASGRHGWAGVDLFFVVSGYVIPLSLHRGGYQLRDVGRFIAKRLTRLDPPYWATIACVLALNAVSTHVPGFHGEPFLFRPAQLLAHVAYLAPYVGQTWILPVFWTLAIEFQYYLLLGLVFPWLMAGGARWRLLVALAVALAGVLLPGEALTFPHYAPLFAMGFAVFLRDVGRISTRAAAVVVALSTLAIAYGAMQFGTLTPAIAAGVGAATAIVIAAGSSAVVRRALETRVSHLLAWAGGISYSLYLTHLPIGGRAINLGARFAHTTASRIAVLLVATAMMLLAAWLFERLVERPSSRWSTSIKLHRREDVPAAARPVAARADAV